MSKRVSVRQNGTVVLARKLMFAAGLAGVCSMSAARADIEPAFYDVVLAGGRVIDPETRLDGIRHVGIRHGKIAAISTSALVGKMIIDVKGNVVAPGFIDLHSHGIEPVTARLQALDGVTTQLELELGVYPVQPWYAERAGRSIINFGASVGHGSARAGVMHGNVVGSMKTGDGARRLPPRPARWADAAATPEELELLEQKLQKGLDDGALGIGFGLAYTPATTRMEIWRMFAIGARNDVRSFVHMRHGGSSGDTGATAALQEVLSNAATLGAALHVAHVASTGRESTPELLRMMDAARAHGIDVTTEAYPWAGTSTAIGSAIFDPGWEVRVGAAPSDLEWPATGERLNAESFERYRREQPRASVIAHIIPEPAIEAAIRHPGVAVVSDSPSYQAGTGHPRGAGSFARFLGRYVRERGMLPLTDALARMTIIPALIMQGSVPAFARKGRVQVGSEADLTVFDPETIVEGATFSSPLSPSHGIRYVLVAGTFVVRDGLLVEGAFPGKGIVRNASVDLRTSR
jgi:N-acyl-D-aspartate/D-glutamate deacylase